MGVTWYEGMSLPQVMASVVQPEPVEAGTFDRSRYKKGLPPATPLIKHANFSMTFSSSVPILIKGYL